MAEDAQAVPDEWLIAAAARDPAAFTQLYRRHYVTVLRHCVRRLFDRSAAEDVTSVVFMQVVRNLHRFSGNGRQFRGWLVRITTNAVNEHLRKVRRHRDLLRGAAAAKRAASGGGVADPDGLEVLKKAILALKPKHQTIICLRFFEGMKLTEVAGLLDCSAATARSRLRRALATLRKALGEAYGYSPREV